MDHTVVTYLVYLGIAVPLTVWVASTLRRNGLRFLVDVFGDPELAASVNQLLVVGFYLVNLGFVALFLRIDADVLDVRGVIETLSVKLGIVLLALGVLHLINVRVFTALRNRSRREAAAVQRGPLMPPAPMPDPTPR
ncbi:hypothetical protein ACQEVB_01220 [Pseudonocardia sp. CA-107938]|uniref:hypothetical protein n=1 Tax=Pseudonocardia sp. CA-107938 TaxID=3240021 RepID=UPI003D92F8A0